MAVNEKNTVVVRVVTIPATEAAKIVPAVLQYYLNHVPGSSD